MSDQERSNLIESAASMARTMLNILLIALAEDCPPAEGEVRNAIWAAMELMSMPRSSCIKALLSWQKCKAYLGRPNLTRPRGGLLCFRDCSPREQWGSNEVWSEAESKKANSEELA